ncbi:hypothetical protein [Chengkuizengella axinellae]|uniref:Uncharacterized protein n=1 Tax=Chengkuizengella axinellae TaxID=3064388 RepID=A0ABT9J0K8_9BACL|nr:hypothetical protein [Chengkuizengella sp. 2205SS18-9]MDP5275161.1 hypothetical protein [Chengkuizengella sp. 2205SS18-9]
MKNHNEGQERENNKFNKNEGAKKNQEDEAIQALKAEIQENDDNPNEC